MKFDDLKDFIENSMKPLENYQPVVIAALVQNGGNATREELKIQLQKANPERDLDHFSQCPAFDIITRSVERMKKELYNGNKIALESNGTFHMLDFDSYTTEQKAWIIVECILKDKRKKDHLEESIEIIRCLMKMQPELQQDKKEVLDKYGKIFTSKNIDKLTSETYKGFLLYENNRHWTYLWRDGGNKSKDMPKLKKTLKILVDENIPIEQRIKQLRDPKKLLLGLATSTAILLVASNLKYPVLNGKVVGALDHLGFISEESKGYEYWDRVVLQQEIVMQIADRYNFDLWQIDWVWWDVMSAKNRSNMGKKYWLLIPGSSDGAFLSQYIKDGKISIGYVDLFLPRYLNRDGTSGIHTSKLLEDIKNKMEERELAKATKEKRPVEKFSKRKVRWRMTYFSQFMQIQKDDVILLWNGSDVLYAKGRAKDNRYRYVKPVKPSNHNHVRNVIWDEVYNER